MIAARRLLSSIGSRLLSGELGLSIKSHFITRTGSLLRLLLVPLSIHAFVFPSLPSASPYSRTLHLSLSKLSRLTNRLTILYVIDETLISDPTSAWSPTKSSSLPCGSSSYNNGTSQSYTAHYPVQVVPVPRPSVEGKSSRVISLDFHSLLWAFGQMGGAGITADNQSASPESPRRETRFRTNHPAFHIPSAPFRSSYELNRESDSRCSCPACVEQDC